MTRFALTAACVACLAVACSDLRPRERRVPLKERMTKAAATAASTAVPEELMAAAFCTDTSETTAMRCADGVAMRSGDTIVIRLSNVGASKRVDVPGEGDEYRRYYYAGRFGGDNGTPAFHILDLRTLDGGAIELINAATGDSLIVRGVPVLSPDGTRFAAVAEPDTCALPAQLEVWRVTGDKPVQEHTMQPFDCTSGIGWGPSDVAWRARDTISLLRNTLPADSARRALGERDTTRALLVRVAGKWTLDTAVRR